MFNLGAAQMGLRSGLDAFASLLTVADFVSGRASVFSLRSLCWGVFSF